MSDALIHSMFLNLLYSVNIDQFRNLNSHFHKKVVSLKKKHPNKDAGINHNWNCNTFNSIGLYALEDDPKFQDLNHEIMNHVKKFSDVFGADIKNVESTGAWINLAGPGCYQEYHRHPNSHFSFVYYVKVPQNSGNIVFESHDYISDMFPLPIQRVTPPSFKHYTYVPKECDLIIFRSNMQHMVTFNASNEDRVSISGNVVFQ